MRKTAVILVLAFVLAAPAGAAAQDRPVTFNLGGGVTFPFGDLKDTFDTGWNLQFGGQINFTENVGLEIDYMYHRMNGPDRSFPSLDGGSVLIESNHQMHVGSFNLIFRTPQRGAVGGYFLAGPGIYHRIVQLTSPAVGFVTVCDPFWLVCFPDAVEVDRIIGDRSSTDFGFDFGGGVTFGTSAKFFVEVLYHYVWGDDFTLPDGSTRSSTAQYVPITFGVRF